MYIPNKVRHFLRTPIQVRGVTCAPSFPVSEALDPSAKTWDKARQWARFRENSQTHLEVVQDNIPRGGYRVVGAEQRSEGGRAWRVLTPDNFLVDLREDVFLPILLEKGLPATRIIDAEFQWCVSGSQIRLEQVGSTSHAKYVTEEEMLARKPPKKAKKAGT